MSQKLAPSVADRLAGMHWLENGCLVTLAWLTFRCFQQVRKQLVVRKLNCAAAAGDDAYLKHALSSAKSQGLETHTVYQLVNAMMHGSAGSMKKALQLAKCAGFKDTPAYKACSNEKDETEKAQMEAFQSDMLLMSRKVPVLLLSAPEYDQDGQVVLAKAKMLVETCGGANIAGDAKDDFHKNIMTAQEMGKLQGWRTAWKGKVCAAISLRQQDYPDLPVIVLTIDGGPECQWEYKQITGCIKDQFRVISIRRFADFKSFDAFFRGLLLCRGAGCCA